MINEFSFAKKFSFFSNFLANKTDSYNFFLFSQSQHTLNVIKFGLDCSLQSIKKNTVVQNILKIYMLTIE